MDLHELTDELLRLSRLLDSGLQAMRDQAVELAEAESEYRHARSVAYISTPRETDVGKIAAGERDAIVDDATRKERHRRDLADGMRQAALEAVRSRRQQLSALQTIANALRTEMEFARTGPEMAA